MSRHDLKGLGVALATLAASAGVSAAPAQADDALPILTVAYFNGDCPSGWEAVTHASGRTILPSPRGGGAGAVGDPNATLSPGETPMHTHSTATGKVSTSSQEFALIAGCCNGNLAHAGTYGMPGYAEEASSGLPYIQYKACRKTSPADEGTIPSGVMTFMDTPNCGDGWDEYAAARGRYLVALPTQGSVAASFGGQPLQSGEVRTHAHDISGSVTFPSSNVAGASGCCAKHYAGAGTELILDAYTTPKQDPSHPRDSAVNMPYYTAPLCEKN